MVCVSEPSCEQFVSNNGMSIVVKILAESQVIVLWLQNPWFIELIKHFNWSELFELEDKRAFFNYFDLCLTLNFL